MRGAYPWSRNLFIQIRNSSDPKISSQLLIPLANALAYQVFNGDIGNPVFSNYLNGVDGPYTTDSDVLTDADTSQSSNRYFEMDHGSLSNYSNLLDELHQSMLSEFFRIEVFDPTNEFEELPLGNIPPSVENPISENDQKRNWQFALYLASLANSETLQHHKQDVATTSIVISECYLSFPEPP